MVSPNHGAKERLNSGTYDARSHGHQPLQPTYVAPPVTQRVEQLNPNAFQQRPVNHPSAPAAVYTDYSHHQPKERLSQDEYYNRGYAAPAPNPQGPTVIVVDQDQSRIGTRPVIVNPNSRASNRVAAFVIAIFVGFTIAVITHFTPLGLIIAALTSTLVFQRSSRDRPHAPHAVRT